jgi:hypothetical protein
VTVALRRCVWVIDDVAVVCAIPSEISHILDGLFENFYGAIVEIEGAIRCAALRGLLFTHYPVLQKAKALIAFRAQQSAHVIFLGLVKMIVVDVAMAGSEEPAADLATVVLHLCKISVQTNRHEVSLSWVSDQKSAAEAALL